MEVLPIPPITPEGKRIQGTMSVEESGSSKRTIQEDKMKIAGD